MSSTHLLSFTLWLPCALFCWPDIPHSCTDYALMGSFRLQILRLRTKALSFSPINLLLSRQFRSCKICHYDKWYKWPRFVDLISHPRSNVHRTGKNKPFHIGICTVSYAWVTPSTTSHIYYRILTPRQRVPTRVSENIVWGCARNIGINIQKCWNSAKNSLCSTKYRENICPSIGNTGSHGYEK